MNQNLRYVRPVSPQKEAISWMLAEAIMPEENVKQILSVHPTLSWVGDESAVSGEEQGFPRTTFEERQAKLFLPESRAAAERARIILSACPQVKQFKTDAYSLKHSVEAWIRTFHVQDILGTKIIRSDRTDDVWRRSIYISQGALLVGAAAAGFRWRNRQYRTLVNVGQTAQAPVNISFPIGKRKFNRMTKELSEPELQAQAFRAALPQKEC